jgi:transposase
MNRIEVITSVERRRRWSRAEKERWVGALEEPGAVAAEIARAAGVDRSLLYRWRQQLAASREAPCFVPVAIADAAPERVAELSPSSAITITIEFSGGVRLKVEGAPDVGTLTRVIDALSRAERRR